MAMTYKQAVNQLLDRSYYGITIDELVEVAYLVLPEPPNTYIGEYASLKKDLLLTNSKTIIWLACVQRVLTNP